MAITTFRTVIEEFVDDVVWGLTDLAIAASYSASKSSLVSFLVHEVLSSDKVKAKVDELEAKGVHILLDKAEHGLSELKDMVENAIKNKYPLVAQRLAEIEAKASADWRGLNISPEDVQKLAKAASSGKLKDFLDQLKDDAKKELQDRLGF